MSASWQDYPDFDALVAALLPRLETLCHRAVAERGAAVLALAGGGTPLPLYRQMAALPLPWSRITVTPTDERCVPHEHPACNLRELRDAFVAARGLQLLSLTPVDGDPKQAPGFAQAALNACTGPFDAVLLGMGNDTHMASLFPGVPGLARALDPASSLDACRIDPDPLPAHAPYSRVTLTLARLLRARELHLVIVGPDKRDTLQSAYDSADALRHPVAALLHAPGANVHIHWSA